MLAAALAGCGDEEEPGGGTGTAEQETALEITLDRDGDGASPAETVTVACPGDGEPVCGLVAALPADADAPTPADTACTEIFGGPEYALIEGSIEGKPIDVELTRANGCEIERFDLFVPLLAALFDGYRPGGALGDQPVGAGPGG